MCFRYILFITYFDEFPDIQISTQEHCDFAWCRFDQLSQFILAPDLNACLNYARRFLEPPESQLLLFPNLQKNPITSHGQRATDEAIKKHISFIQQDFPTCREIQYDLVFGPSGAGKSTAIERFVKTRTQDREHRETRTILSPGSRLNRYLNKLFLESDIKFALAFQIDAVVMRFAHLIEARDDVIMEQGLISILAYSKALRRLNWLSEDEYATFFNVFSLCQKLIPQPHRATHVTASTDVLMKRIVARGRKIEKVYTEQYVQEARRVCTKLPKSYRLQVRFTS